jgi:hypothetical protein
MIHVTARPDADPKLAVAIATAVVEEREKILRRVARIAARVSAGAIYEQSAFLTCREIFGPDVVNLHTWNAVYGGTRLDTASLVRYHDEATRAENPFPRPVREDLIAERDRARGITTGPYNVRDTVADSRGGSTRDCTCDMCWDYRERYDRANDRIPTAPVPAPPTVAPEPEESDRACECDGCTDTACQGDCSPCSDCGCEQCNPDQCDDHGCDTCYGDHTVEECCGYCSDCEHHPDGGGGDYYCSECERCSECEHHCPGI